MYKTSREKGFTLIEILTVISIISILFLVFIPQVNGFFIKAKESGVKTDFRSFQQSSEAYLRESQGGNASLLSLNKYFDSSNNLLLNGSNLRTSSVDPWGNPYFVTFENAKIEFSSNGELEDVSVAKYKLITYYYKGVVASCTLGFSSGNIELRNLPVDIDCGDELPSQPFIPEVPDVVIEPPNEPTNFRLNNITSDAADLAWNASVGATSYVLKRNGIIVYEGNTTNFLDRNLSEYSAYNYVLFARNSAGDSTTISIIGRTKPTESTIKLPDFGSGVCNTDPYIISTVGELQGIKLDLDACFELGKDIDASFTSAWNEGLGFSPIKNNSVYFTGELDGKGFAINNLFINRPSEEWVGLFNSIDKTANVKNLTLKNANITGSEYVGALAGFVQKTGSVSKINVQGVVNGNEDTGGIAGLNRGTMTDLTSQVTVKGVIEAGGVTGSNEGIVKKVLVLNSSSIVGIETIGGVVGFQDEQASLEDARVESISVSGDGDIGGLIGANFGTITNSTSAANITSSGFGAGGIVGYNLGTISSVNSNGQIDGHELIGGIAGYNYGNIYEAISYNNILGEARVGGVVGYNRGKILSVYSIGNIVGVNYVGGAVGLNIGIIENSYARSSVKGTTDVGGFAGRNESGGNITYVYASGSVSGSVNVGGLVGRHKTEEATINFGYYDANTTGQADTGKGIKKTTAEMKMQTSYVGWNFTTTWQIDTTKNNGFPTLKFN